MGWWLGVLAASVLIMANNLLLRAIGFRPGIVLLLLPLLIGAQLGYSYAYGHAPKFIQVWFLGTAALSVLGLTASYLTDRTLALSDLMGVGCIALGSYMLLR